MASEMKRLERSAGKDGERSDMNKMSFSALPGMTEATSQQQAPMALIEAELESIKSEMALSANKTEDLHKGYKEAQAMI